MGKRLLTCLGGLSIAVAAIAAPPARAADAAPAKDVLAQIAEDLNGDGIKDRAELLHDADGDDVDLAIYLSADGKLPDRPTLYKAAFGWTGTMAGTQPELKVNHARSLIVVFQNDAIGRDRWRRQLTLAFRGGVFVVAGYTYEERDTLMPGKGGQCDLNLLSGQGTRNGKPVKFTAPPIPLSDWTDEAAPKVCDF